MAPFSIKTLHFGTAEAKGKFIPVLNVVAPQHQGMRSSGVATGLILDLSCFTASVLVCLAWPSQ